MLGLLRKGLKSLVDWLYLCRKLETLVI